MGARFAAEELKAKTVYIIHDKRYDRGAPTISAAKRKVEPQDIGL
jgi:hypothetical protein